MTKSSDWVKFLLPQWLLKGIVLITWQVAICLDSRSKHKLKVIILLRNSTLLGGRSFLRLLLVRSFIHVHFWMHSTLHWNSAYVLHFFCGYEVVRIHKQWSFRQEEWWFMFTKNPGKWNRLLYCHYYGCYISFTLFYGSSLLNHLNLELFWKAAGNL